MSDATVASGLIVSGPALGRVSAFPSAHRTGLPVAVSSVVHVVALGLTLLAVRGVASPPEPPPDIVDMVMLPEAKPTPAAASPSVASTPAPIVPPQAVPPQAVPPPPPPAPAADPEPIATHFSPPQPPPPAPHPKPVVKAVAPHMTAPAAKPPAHPSTVAAAPVVPAAGPAAPAVAHGPASRAAVPIAGLASNGKPDYPALSLRRREQGEVVILVTVGPDGVPRAAVVRQSSGHTLLDEAAVAKVMRDWRFVPATRDGVAVAGTAEVPFSFVLGN